MDLILVIALPPPAATASTAQLKVRVIKDTLDFMVGSLGGNGRDRISLVTFEVGLGGRVRKTGFLTVGRSSGRLHAFIDGIKWGGESNVRPEDEDEWAVKGTREEKTDVVTAVNHGTFLSMLSELLSNLCSQPWTSFSNENPRTPSAG